MDQDKAKTLVKKAADLFAEPSASEVFDQLGRTSNVSNRTNPESFRESIGGASSSSSVRQKQQ